LEEGGLDLQEKVLMDVAGLVDVLQEEDSLEQQHVYDAVCNHPDDDASYKRYDELPELVLNVDKMRAMYEGQKETTAMSLLHKRVKLEIDPSKKVRMDDADFAFSCTKSYLDFLMIVGDKRGLDMFLPKRASGTGFTLSLRLDLQIKEFRVKHGNLGFDPTGCMLCVGMMANEDLWIGMAPGSYFEEVGATFNMNERHGDTRLTVARYRQMLAYIIYTLTKLDDHYIYVHEPYRINLGDGPHNLRTNAL
jgi:hypothetical protein